MPKVRLPLQTNSYHSQFLQTLTNSFLQNVHRRNPASQLLTYPQLLTQHPLLDFEATFISNIESYQIFNLLCKLRYSSENHCIFILADIQNSEIFFPGHLKLFHQNLKIRQPLLKFSTGTELFTLPPDIFISDTYFQIHSLTLPVFGENLLYSFDFSRFAQVESQRGFLFLPSKPSKYLNPLSLQLPPQSIHQHPLPSPPSHPRHHPPASLRHNPPPPPRD